MFAGTFPKVTVAGPTAAALGQLANVHTAVLSKFTHILAVLGKPGPVKYGVGITTLVVVGTGTELASATDSDEGCVTLYAINCYL